VTLRPVSELGLVDVTDLASRQADDTKSVGAAKTKSSGRSHDSAATKAKRAEPSRGRSNGSKGTSKIASSRRAKDASSTPGRKRPETPRTTPSTSVASKGPIGQKSVNSRPTSASASASTPKRRKALGTGSRGSGPAASQRKWTGDSRETQSTSQNGQSHREIKALAANLGIGAVTGAIGVAGGVLMVRAARQRPRRILGIPLSA
jgi:hypothetical protein